MAKSMALAGLGLLLMVGCQSGNNEAVQEMPAPSLEGPVVLAPPPPPVVAAQPAAKTAQPSGPAVNAAPVAVAKRPGNVPADWIPTAPINTWKWIVIHHSATPTGSASQFDREHRHKGWDELGYHFVIGNGTGSGDGQIEVGPRWPKQKYGAHAKTPGQEFNNFGIGICLVGNFDLDRPSPNQVRALAKLVSYLQKTYGIPSSHVIGHSDTKPTDCPGRHVSVAQIRQMARQMAEDVDGAQFLMPDPTVTAGTELLKNVGE